MAFQSVQTNPYLESLVKQKHSTSVVILPNVLIQTQSWKLLNPGPIRETTNLVLILGSTVNDNTGSEGLSCQSEVIGLLIVLQNKRRL